MFGNAEAYEPFMGRWSHFSASLRGFTDFCDTGCLIVDSGTGSENVEVQ